MSLSCETIPYCQRSHRAVYRAFLPVAAANLRNSMLQDRLSELAILSIENVAAQKLDINTVLDDFTRRKARLRLVLTNDYIASALVMQLLV